MKCVRPTLPAAAVAVWLLLGLSSAVCAQQPLHPLEPVITQVTPHATTDKPQSKLWYAHGHWWVWLPTQQGSSVWKRSASGWKRIRPLDGHLRGLPGQADVHAKGDAVRAVLIGPERMAVVRLRFHRGRRIYVPHGAPIVWPIADAPEGGKRTETATIARDGARRWWVAYDEGRHMWARASLGASGNRWTDPIRIGGPAAGDDVCAIAAIPGGVGVIWSDQTAEALYFRHHLDGRPAETWEDTETVAKGGRTADDHLNVAIGPDGTVYVATKTSIDTDGQPQLCLRIRRLDGTWENHQYANRTALWEPSRPIVALGGNPLSLFLCHALYPRGSSASDSPRRFAYIAVIECDADELDLAKPSRELISANRLVNNVTSCKSILPRRAPWIAIASDGAGNVYEGILSAPGQ